MPLHIQGFSEKTVRLALARAANAAMTRATQLHEQGRPEDDAEYIVQVAIGNALLSVAAAISEAFETGILPDPFPEVNDELAPGSGT